MNLTWTYAILSLLVIANAVSEDELKTFISLTKYSYEDSCSKTGDIEWTFINKPTNHTRQLWETAMSEYAQHKMKQMNETRELVIENFDDPSLKYTFYMVVNPGDSLLLADDFNKLVSFISHAELLRLAGYYVTGTRKYFRQDVERYLGRSARPEDKLASWSAWHQTLAPLEANFSRNLELAQNAALANGKNDVAEYWEMLCDAENGYEKATDEWNKLSDLYSQILKFVKKRLTAKYRIDNNTLPAHLLGSLKGYDWTNIAMDVVPHSNTMYNIRKNLWEHEIVGKTLYREASKLGVAVLKHVPQASFWNESEFRGQCPSHLINLCHDGNMRISTCNEASISNFISAHKNVAKILVNQMSSRNDPVLNIANRYSVLEEGIAEVFGILSMSPAWLISRGLISNTTDLDEARTVSLMITALDVLPRMAYYLAADKWRIDAIKNNSLNTADLASTWWQYRTEYEGVNTSVPNLPTFLDDDYITSNRPYLSKFLGTILGFQLYEYLMVYTEVRYDPINIEQPMRHRFGKMVHQDVVKHWPDVIKQLDIDELSVDNLLSYFGPLIEFLVESEESDEKPSIPFDLERNLDGLQDTYRKKFNAPTTTTTSTTSTTTIRPVLSKSSKNNNPVNPSKSAVSEGSAVSSSNATKSVIVEVPPAHETEETPIKGEPVQSDGDIPSEENPKTNTSKAVWAVAAVLVATITICIIAIFGRRRCRKAPKNRRYV